MRHRQLNLIPASVFVGIVAATCLYPFVFVGFNSFRTSVEFTENPLGVPTHPTMSFVRQAWTQGRVADYAKNSLIVVTAATVIILVLALLAGFALSHMRLRFAKAGVFIVIIMMLLPPSVLMVPIFKTVHTFGLLNTYTGLILVYASLNLPFSIYLAVAYFRRIPAELFQAADIDGANEVRQFVTIAVPLAAPAAATLVVLNFLWLWNELLFSLLILQSDAKRTLMVGLTLLQGQYSTPVPLMASALLISLLPPLAAFLFFQRYLRAGLVGGALK